MLFYFKIQSKSDKVLKIFFLFLQKLNTLIILLKPISQKKQRKLLSVLNSPHVNKTAQEQFEFKQYRKNFLIRLTKPLTVFFILKKLRNLSFFNISLKIKKLSNQNILKLIDPNNLNLKLNKPVFIKTYYIKLFDYYGELYLKLFCLKQNKKKNF